MASAEMVLKTFMLPIEGIVNQEVAVSNVDLAYGGVITCPATVGVQAKGRDGTTGSVAFQFLSIFTERHSDWRWFQSLRKVDFYGAGQWLTDILV
jgi:hypothetical protein